MKTRFVVVGIALAATMTAIAGYWWFRTPELVRCYAQITSGMPIEQIREIIGREEDPPDSRPTINGEFERSWSFSDGGRITVVFDAAGTLVYKEIAPIGCGVTPLMGKYVDE
jgi:hypothetical protein